MPPDRPTASWCGCNKRRLPPKRQFPYCPVHCSTGAGMAVVADKVRSREPTRGLMAIVAFATQSHARAAMVLALIALLNFLPGFFSIPPTDRDESRFAQASKQMIESGDFIDIRFQETTRYKKPVGIYWLQA